MLELIRTLIDFILHIDQHLVEIVSEYKTWTYLILFLIIFAETGLVVTPFLPGDSSAVCCGRYYRKTRKQFEYFIDLSFVNCCRNFR